VDNEEIENLFRCLDVEKIIEIFSYILLEKKVLMISQHKSLLTQIDVLEAPFPYLIGIEPNS